MTGYDPSIYQHLEDTLLCPGYDRAAVLGGSTVWQ